MDKLYLNKFIPAAFLLTFMAFIAFGAIEQTIRQSANSPQIQMSEDMSVLLSDGRNPKEVLPNSNLDQIGSLKPFTIVYDDNYTPIATTAKFKDSIPVPPDGVFDYAKKIGEDRFIWRLRDGTRIAAVINRYNGMNPGYVLSGRNLQETEIIIDNIFNLIMLGYFTGLGVAFTLSLILSHKK